jgi:hypothetical protein
MHGNRNKCSSRRTRCRIRRPRRGVKPVSGVLRSRNRDLPLLTFRQGHYWPQMHADKKAARSYLCSSVAKFAFCEAGPGLNSSRPRNCGPLHEVGQGHERVLGGMMAPSPTWFRNYGDLFCGCVPYRSLAVAALYAASFRAAAASAHFGNDRLSKCPVAESTEVWILRRYGSAPGWTIAPCAGNPVPGAPSKPGAAVRRSGIRTGRARATLGPYASTCTRGRRFALGSVSIDPPSLPVARLPPFDFARLMV